jgi:hypothetical protein
MMHQERAANDPRCAWKKGSRGPRIIYKLDKSWDKCILMYINVITCDPNMCGGYYIIIYKWDIYIMGTIYIYTMG